MASEHSRREVRTARAERAAGAAAWQATRRRLLIRISALMGAGLLPALTVGQSVESGGAPPAAATPPPNDGPDVRAEVSFRSVPAASRLDSRFAGLSYEKTKLAVSMFTGANTPLIELFNLLGPAVLRIGANAVDRSSWNGTVDALTPILPSQVDDLAAFVKATQWQVIYGVNLARNTPENAAAEAAYVAERLGPSLLAWEIGNEPDLYTRLGYRPDDWGYEDYLGEWRALRAAISAAAPGVAFSGPGTTFALERNTLLFARDERAHLELLTHHYYRAGRYDPDSTLALLLEPDPALASELGRLVAAASEAGIPSGVRLTEANSFFGGGLPGASNAFGSALWAMDFLFTCALAGCTGVNLHGGNRGPYTPIGDRDGTVVDVRPLFYGMVMFAQAARGLPLQSVMAADVDINVSAWGVQRDDGGLNALLLNKDDRRSVGMHLSTGIAAGRFELLWLQGEGLTATDGQTLGGVPIDADGSWAPQAESRRADTGRVEVVLPPATAVLVRSRA